MKEVLTGSTWKKEIRVIRAGTGRDGKNWHERKRKRKRERVGDVDRRGLQRQ